MPADQQYQDHQEHYSAEPIHGIDEISVPTQAASNNWVANAIHRVTRSFDHVKR